MGLNMCVNYLGGLDESEEKEEALESALRPAHLNELLAGEGLPAHDEPTDDVGSDEFDMGSYSTLHYCRRAAAHLWMNGRIESPGGDDSGSDPVLQEYCAAAVFEEAALEGCSRLWTPERRGLAFHHLVHHQDNGGIYLPITFEKVLVRPMIGGDDYDMIGSTSRLLSECRVVANALDIPRISTPIPPSSGMPIAIQALWAGSE